MNIPLKDLYPIIDAFKQGYRDAFNRGIYNNVFQDTYSSSYKQGYDFGMTIYCEVNHPEEEKEAHE